MVSRDPPPTACASRPSLLCVLLWVYTIVYFLDERLHGLQLLWTFFKKKKRTWLCFNTQPSVQPKNRKHHSKITKKWYFIGNAWQVANIVNQNWTLRGWSLPWQVWLGWLGGVLRSRVVSWSGHMPWFWVRSRLGHVGEATYLCFSLTSTFLSLSFSLPIPSLKIKKRKNLKKKNHTSNKDTNTPRELGKKEN